MPPGGVHLLACVGVLRLTHGAVDALAWKRFPLVNTKDRLKALVNGFILGCIAPDADLLLCVLIGSFTNIQEKDLENVHRTFSHSLVVLPIAASVAIGVLNRCEGRQGTALRPTARRLGLLGEEKSTSSMPQLLSLFILATACGCMFHALLDLFYVMKLKLLWPYPLHIGFPVFFPLDLLSEREKKLLMMADFAADFLWYLPISMNLKKNQSSKTIFAVLMSYVLWLGLAASWLEESTVLFTRRLYIVGTLWCALLIFSPCIYSDAVVEMVTKKSVIKAPKERKSELGILLAFMDYLIPLPR